jgi:hypothetical protein
MNIDSAFSWPVNEGPHDSRRWGPHFWRFLHLYTALGPRTWTPDSVACVTSLLKTLPCDVCTKHALAYLSQNPPVPLKETHTALSPSEWVLELHNHVAAKHAHSTTVAKWDVSHLSAAVVSWLQLPTDYARVSDRLDVIEHILSRPVSKKPSRPTPSVQKTSQDMPGSIKMSSELQVDATKVSRSLFYQVCCEHDTQLSQMSGKKASRITIFRAMWKCIIANRASHDWKRWPCIFRKIRD